MIRGLHGMIYSSDADASRAFMRDKLGLPFTDTGGGWLIFDLPEGDLGFHPIDPSAGPMGGQAGDHDVSFYCDDIKGTVAQLRARGVEFKSEIADHGYGWVTHFSIPGGIEVQLYEPKYQKRVRTTAAAVKEAARKPAVKAAGAMKKAAAAVKKAANKARAGATRTGGNVKAKVSAKVKSARAKAARARGR